MRFINKKMVVVVLLIIEFTCGYLMYQSSKKEVDLAKVTYEEETNNNMFAMYVENEDTGEYDEVTNTNTFPEGYILNMDKTGCIDNKGNSISDILTSKDDKVMVKSNKTVFCYLYFDKDNRVFAQVKRDYKNSNGALLLSETESDKYPVYYYSGNITNNNILYANFCWKMVRTTETGGVKLIYNGIPDEAEDGTLTCDNTGEESQIGTSKFNSSSNSLAYAGYMYGETYTANTKNFVDTKIVSIPLNSSTSIFYYGDIATWDGSKYVLSNSDGSEVTTYTWADNYKNLIGKYTCSSTTATSCTSVKYVVGGDSSYMYYYELTNGKTKDDYKIKLATEITDNGDGTYTLVNPIEVSKAEWYTNYSNYKNYYYCADLISETCEIMYFSKNTTNYQIHGLKMDAYKYGNSFTYENGTYKLIDTEVSSIKQFWNWHANYNTLSNNHYTCFNTTGECTDLKYIYSVANEKANYIILTGGTSVEEAINKMLYADNVNKTNSAIKDYIDSWYENNIVDILDYNETLYSKYLENTKWCNDRKIADLAGWNPNGGDMTKILSFYYNSLDCENKTDQFTLKVEAGGTEGYGNNALDYPVGLISHKEASLATGTGYLHSGSNYWLFSLLNYYYSNLVFGFRVGGSDGWLHGTNLDAIHGVRPAVSLSNKVEIFGGDGSVTLPYQVELSS